MDSAFRYLDSDEMGADFEESDVCFRAANLFFEVKNSANNNIPDGRFPLIRALCMKTPSRPCKMSAIFRDDANIVYLARQKRYFREIARVVFGTLQGLMGSAEENVSQRNSWGAFFTTTSGRHSEISFFGLASTKRKCLGGRYCRRTLRAMKWNYRDAPSGFLPVQRDGAVRVNRQESTYRIG